MKMWKDAADEVEQSVSITVYLTWKQEFFVLCSFAQLF